MSHQTIRHASHAGSWYQDSAPELSRQLDNWLAQVPEGLHSPARAVIVPHAGYQYCASCAAYAYRQVDPNLSHVVQAMIIMQCCRKRVFIVGPSHYARLTGCALSQAKLYQTPFYNLTIDQTSVQRVISVRLMDAAVYGELYATEMFESMSLMADEDEHSLEMQLPFIAKVMSGHNFTIVPIMVGSLTPEKEASYGALLSRYLADPSNLFVISSDFCHWGARFHYQYYDKSWGDIHQAIQKLDEMAMKIIEDLSPTGFVSYLKKYSNTICGRHPIGILLNECRFYGNWQFTASRWTGNGHKMSIKFLNYAQSNQCMNMQDSSVSYASAALTFHPV
ncbi:MEMO1 [Cordylochernes scorpioides]|uniref:MEMO1 n=1 Tax=Cordylochernes scorpioides TaxID=51811 RepID=A0ABY6LJC2_9ARAC|nr:MEMO1 [Cordylochernes scorpioides]